MVLEHHECSHHPRIVHLEIVKMANFMHIFITI